LDKKNTKGVDIAIFDSLHANTRRLYFANSFKKLEKHMRIGDLFDSVSITLIKGGLIYVKRIFLLLNDRVLCDVYPNQKLSDNGGGDTTKEIKIEQDIRILRKRYVTECIPGNKLNCISQVASADFGHTWSRKYLQNPNGQYIGKEFAWCDDFTAYVYTACSTHDFIKDLRNGFEMHHIFGDRGQFLSYDVMNGIGKEDISRLISYVHQGFYCHITKADKIMDAGHATIFLAWCDDQGDTSNEAILNNMKKRSSKYACFFWAIGGNQSNIVKTSMYAITNNLEKFRNSGEFHEEDFQTMRAVVWETNSTAGFGYLV